MTPTDEQALIIRAAKTKQSLKVSAFAGTGKTSTFILIAKAMPETHFLYLAFNKAIATEATAKFRTAGATNVTVKTAHALAYASVGRDYSHRLETRRWALIRAVEEQFRDDIAALAVGRKAISETVQAALETIHSFEASADSEIALTHVPVDAGVLGQRIMRLASRIWENMRDEKGSLPVTHDTYFKVWALSKPTLRWDALLWDEAQDASPVMLGVVAEQHHLQRIFVGDTHQSIYGFRKAVDAIESLDLPMLPLTQSWRFGANIAASANSLLATKGETILLRGNPAITDAVVDTSDKMPDAILSRTNAGLFGEAVKLLGHDVTFGVVGGAAEVCDAVQAAYDIYASGSSPHPSFKFFRTWEIFKEAAESASGAAYRPFVKIVEEYKHQIPTLCTAVRTRAVEVEKATVVLSTSHRFKGQERPHVRIAEDFSPFCFFDSRKREWVWLPEEVNVQYVTLTRAQELLELGGYAEVLATSISQRAKMLEQQAKAARPVRVVDGMATWSAR